MDDDIEEIKELAKKSLALAQDTNRVVHGMRRGAWWGRFFKLLWWVAIFAVSSAVYYYYVQPYVDKIGQAYAQVQSTGQKAQSLESQVQNFLKNLGTSQNATSSQQ
ncbi:MAG: hypothetical protein Q7S26_03655 [bacterium]|nr:hypothetical protein [bacterium]